MVLWKYFCVAFYFTELSESYSTKFEVSTVCPHFLCALVAEFALEIHYCIAQERKGGNT